MSDPDADPIIVHLLARKAELERDLATTAARLLEVEAMLAAMSDGRSRVRRRLREVPAPPDSQPEQVA